MVLSKWLRSLRYGNDYFRLIDAQAYFRVYHDYIEGILARSRTRMRLAVLTDDHDVVLGFAAHEGGILHYVHVHKDMRKQGIGRALLPDDIDTITHVTNIGLSIWGSKFPAWKLNPF
jgi:GNAT superfamily N-acetyltransferase